ncbi:MAG: hypothetical protein PUB56_06875, partial [Paraprevotella sp.]|nr:hypothetical protein [Paraprevotella sp.]
MKKRISIIAVVLAFLALCYVCYVGGQIDQSPHKIWLHRCNSIEKLQEKEARYPNVEVDICLRPGGVMDVTHDMDTTFHLSFTPYLEYLAKHPERHIWMDIKNLSEENVREFKRSLDSLVYTYKVRASSKTRMNSRPMILRLVSGSVTPASAVRNLSRASTVTRRT